MKQSMIKPKQIVGWGLTFALIATMLFLKLEHFALLSDIPVDFSQDEYKHYLSLARATGTLAVIKVVSYFFIRQTQVQNAILSVISGLFMVDGWLYAMDAEPYALQFGISFDLMKQMETMGACQLACGAFILISTLVSMAIRRKNSKMHG